MTPRAVRPARASACAAWLWEARLALCVTLAIDVECIPVATPTRREETGGTRPARRISAV